MAFLVKLCSLVCFKTHMRIKSDRLRILFVYGQLSDSIVLNAILEHLLSNAVSTFLRCKKQHLQATVLNAHKRNRLFRFGNN